MVHSTPKEAGETPSKPVSNVPPAPTVQIGNIFSPVLKMRNTQGQEEPEEGRWHRSGMRTATAADLKKAKMGKKEMVKIRNEGILANEDKGDQLNAAVNKTFAKLFP